MPAFNRLCRGVGWAARVSQELSEVANFLRPARLPATHSMDIPCSRSGWISRKLPPWGTLSAVDLVSGTSVGFRWVSIRIGGARDSPHGHAELRRGGHGRRRARSIAATADEKCAFEKHTGRALVISTARGWLRDAKL